MNALLISQAQYILISATKLKAKRVLNALHYQVEQPFIKQIKYYKTNTYTSALIKTNEKHLALVAIDQARSKNEKNSILNIPSSV